MAQLFTPPFQQTLDANADAISGAQLFFYLSGTNAAEAVYADAALAVPLASPVIADAAGRFVPIYLNPSKRYRVVVADAGGTPIRDVDPISSSDLADLADGEGLGLVGFIQNAQGAEARTALAKLREVPVTPDDFAGTDTQKVQAALDARGSILLTRAYTITSALTMRGDTQLRGKPGAKLVWSGPATGNILQDSSIVTPSDVNLNILLEDFEIVGASLASGDAFQVGVNFYRVGNVTIRRLTVRELGGSGIRWGLSQIDTVGVLVEDCELYDLRHGDAIQGVGRAIVVRNNRIGRIGSTTSNFGDTAIALLYDFSPTTNPGGGFTSDVEISGNTIIGNYTLAGQYVGNGQQIQTGVAFGPFKNGHAANVRVIGNTLFGCYLNLWAIVMDDVLVAQNNFGGHAATATGNTRFDGVTNLRVKDNTITLRLGATGPDYCAVLLVAQRNIYGASVYDSDVSRFEISGNAISSVAPNVQGVRATFEAVNTSPAYVSRLSSGRIEGNTFTNITTPVSLAPQSGTTAAVCNDVLIRGNKVDANAARVVMAGGGIGQYTNSRLRDNPAPGIVPPATGTGASGLKWNHMAMGSVSAASGTAVDLIALPDGNYTVEVAARVAGQNNANLAATATVHVNGTGARITVDNGSLMVLALSGLTIRATQSNGGTADVSFDLQYTL